ncbi:MAG: phytanoyl-CoA dioxygenase [Acidobacteria bacterium]|nr:MAG: phytanoyl-CoA dioxygenase [Acidobacteriota bacterium]
MDFQHHCDEQGFAIIPAVLTDPDISKLEQAFARADVRRSKAGVRHALKHSPVAEMAHDERLLEIVRRVLGTGAFPFRATLFDKSPNSNWLVVWHQDTALPLCEKHETPGWGPWSVKDGVKYAHAPAMTLAQVLALRIHLDDSIADNGPLRVLPGTHKMGVLSDDAIHKLAEEFTSVDCLVPRSGVLAMRPLIVHASSKSRSEMPRRVLHVEYAASRFIENGLELAVA